ncbi:hypothetical protein A6R68_02717 [Neotoma lepida]|uniref:Uncharacterized protein n=1 Tax=Neotoma lepida TaxID=56216 RepID=A0A1A6GRC4_NEOLE|nr:hypothetical protein A6R68_02717 [Neotoma lepida]
MRCSREASNLGRELRMRGSVRRIRAIPSPYHLVVFDGSDMRSLQHVVPLDLWHYEHYELVHKSLSTAAKCSFENMDPNPLLTLLQHLPWSEAVHSQPVAPQPPFPPECLGGGECLAPVAATMGPVTLHKKIHTTTVLFIVQIHILLIQAIIQAKLQMHLMILQMTGLSILALLEKNTTTIVAQKFHSGKNQKSGLKEQRQKEANKLAVNSFPKDRDYRREVMQATATSGFTSGMEDKHSSDASSLLPQNILSQTSRHNDKDYRLPRAETHSSSTPVQHPIKPVVHPTATPSTVPSSPFTLQSDHQPKKSFDANGASTLSKLPTPTASVPAQKTERKESAPGDKSVSHSCTTPSTSSASGLNPTSAPPTSASTDPNLLRQLLPALQATLQLNNSNVDISKINEAAVTQASLQSIIHKFLTAGPSAFNITSLISQAAQLSTQAQPSNQSPMSLTSDASSPRSYVSPRISTPQTNTVPIKPLISTPPVSSQPKRSPSPGPNHTSSSNASNATVVPQNTSARPACSLTPTLAAHFNDNLIKHVQGWPADHAEKQHLCTFSSILYLFRGFSWSGPDFLNVYSLFLTMSVLKVVDRVQGMVKQQVPIESTKKGFDSVTVVQDVGHMDQEAASSPSTEGRKLFHFSKRHNWQGCSVGLEELPQGGRQEGGLKLCSERKQNSEPVKRRAKSVKLGPIRICATETSQEKRRETGKGESRPLPPSLTVLQSRLSFPFALSQFEAALSLLLSKACSNDIGNLFVRKILLKQIQAGLLGSWESTVAVTGKSLNPTVRTDFAEEDKWWAGE